MEVVGEHAQCLTSLWILLEGWLDGTVQPSIFPERGQSEAGSAFGIFEVPEPGQLPMEGNKLEE